MNRKPSWLRSLALFSVVAVCLPVGTASGADPGMCDLPGISGPDVMPNGCVSCHKGASNLKARLAALKHRDISGKVAVVPDDCRSCHTEGSGLESMSMIAHSMHYASGSSSEFVAEFGGQCLHCHTMATGTGAVTVKTGRKNW